MKHLKKFNETLYESPINDEKICNRCKSTDFDYLGPEDYKRDQKGDYNRIHGYKCKSCGEILRYLPKQN